MKTAKPEATSLQIYFNTNTLETEYPSEFVESLNPKSVSVINCVLFYEDPNASNSENKVFYQMTNFHLHASFVHGTDSLNHLVGSIHDNMKIKIFPQSRTDTKFKVWFSDYANRELDMNNYYFTLELLLTF